MIVLTMSSALLLVLQASVDGPRNAFLRCLDQTAANAKTEGVKPEAFADYLKAACAPASTKVVNALVAFDLKNKIPRSQAASDAQMFVDDAMDSKTRTYKRLNSQTAEVQQ